MKQSFSLLVLVLFLFLPFGLPAAIEKDLGQALAYLRVTDADADKQLAIDTIERRPALVLDLRSLAGTRKLAEALHASLAKPAAPHALRIILINATTAPALITAVTETLPSVITIGPKSPVIDPDIVVSISAEDDERAFAALANGTPLEKLITDSQEKPRYDEARLVQDHTNGLAPADGALPADAEDDAITTEPLLEKKAAEAAKKPAPPTDLVLERAVQLHHSLLALKKL